MGSSNNRISNLVSSQLPFFVRQDHQTFIAFMEAYYEYLEQRVDVPLEEGKVVQRAKNILNYIDIDRTLDEFAEKFYKEFISLIPKDTKADKNILIKNAKDFYRAKGTEKALKFLLRLLYDQEPSIYYPKRDVLRASDGKWFVQRSLRVSDVIVNGAPTSSIEDLQRFINRRVVGSTSNTTAAIERVDRYYENGFLLNELILTNIQGTFLNAEEITSEYVEDGVSYTLKATILGGIITSIKITNRGNDYKIGDYLIFESQDSGSGANAVISGVSTGNIRSVTVLSGGAGFEANTNLLSVGGDGAGFNAYVSMVDTSGTVHPNTYNIVSSQISLEANTPIGNSVYSNLNASNANTAVEDAMSYFTYGPVGPVATVFVRNGGSNYTQPPTLDIPINPTVRNLGILGRMEVRVPGQDYEVGDLLRFNSYNGFGANGIISEVDSSGGIVRVSFTANGGFIIGGYNYKQNELPTITIDSVNGTGGVVEATAVLGEGEQFTLATSNVGAIESITIINRGSNYTTPPYINLQSQGDGTATAEATIAAGVYTHPGRYLNDDGHLSGYSFLQDRDYYQNFSYVIKIKESLANYKEVIKNINHPAGLKLFGEYTFNDDTDFIRAKAKPKQLYKRIYHPGSYVYDEPTGVITVTSPGAAVSVSDIVYVEFTEPSDIEADFYSVSSVSGNSFTIAYSEESSYPTGNVLISK